MNQDDQEPGWIYIIINKSLPNILKVGYTKRRPEVRALELYNTGVPTQYKVEFSLEVINPRKVEQMAHEYLKKFNVGKEWFDCDVETAISAIMKANNMKGTVNGLREKQLLDEHSLYLKRLMDLGREPW